MSAERITSRRIVELLRINRHPNGQGEWATFEEVRNGTGYDRQTRYMDLLAINCWPSKKFRSVAYEVKVDRADFMREILDPSKREFAEKVAMETWFATPAGLVKPDEVPEGWGLVTVDSTGKLKTMKMPLQRTPAPWPMSFIASLLRKAADPESKVPEALWKLAGEELTEAQLLDVLEDRLQQGKNMMRHQLRVEVHQEVREEIDETNRLHREAEDMLGTVKLHLGLSRWDKLTPEILKGLLANPASPRVLEALDKAKLHLDHLIATLKQNQS